MNTSGNKQIKLSTVAVDAKIDKDYLSITLEDGRIVSYPLYYFSELEHAKKKQRESVEVFHAGKGLRWKSLNVHLSVPMLLGFGEDD